MPFLWHPAGNQTVPFLLGLSGMPLPLLDSLQYLACIYLPTMPNRTHVPEELTPSRTWCALPQKQAAHQVLAVPP